MNGEDVWFPPEPLIAQAKRIIREGAVIEAAFRRDFDPLLDNCWELGRVLLDLKPTVERGHWHLWINANLPELGSTEAARIRKVQRCMELAAANPDATERPQLTLNSVRKFCLHDVPTKRCPSWRATGRSRASRTIFQFSMSGEECCATKR